MNNFRKNQKTLKSYIYNADTLSGRKIACTTSKKCWIANEKLLSEFNKDGRKQLNRDPELTIVHFNKRGEISDPPVPCNATCIDPYYLRDTSVRQRSRGFLMKSDVLKLRDITRTKFFLYTNQELAFEEQRKIQETQLIYENIMQFYKFCHRKLSEMERNAFEDMQKKCNELTELKNIKKYEIEKERMVTIHQKLNTEIFHVYQRFRYLLKLIEYFDHVSDSGEEVVTFNRIVNSPEMVSLFNELPAKYGSEQVEKLVTLMDLQIRPYLKRKAFTDATIWEKSFQMIRRKIANYNQHLTRVSLLTHLTDVIHDKFDKTNLKRLTRKQFFKNTEFIKDRTKYLQDGANEFLTEFEHCQRKDAKKPLLKGVVNVIVDKLQLNGKSMEISQKEDCSTIDKLERVQMKLMDLLYQLDAGPHAHCQHVEKTVRDQIATQQIQSKEALVLQTRFNNLLDHYRSHYRKKSSGTVTKKPTKKKIFGRTSKISPLATDI